MKALSLTQPYAMLICLPSNSPRIPEKEFETRSWRWTPKPQEIYVHAAKGFPKWARELCQQEPFKSVLARHGYNGAHELPLQQIIGRVRIMRTYKTEVARAVIHKDERAFGNYSDDRIAIQLADPVLLQSFIPCAGMLGLWRVPSEIEILCQTG